MKSRRAERGSIVAAAVELVFGYVRVEVGRHCYEGKGKLGLGLDIFKLIHINMGRVTRPVRDEIFIISFL